MTENCLVMQPCNVEFNLEEDSFVVMFGRLMVPFETLFKSTAKFELNCETKQLKLTSSDWNSFTSAKKLIEDLLKATVSRGLNRDYEDVVNEILTNVKIPKKHLLGKLRDVFIDCNNVAIACGLQNSNFWEPVMTVCEHFESKGHNVVMIVPSYRKKLANAEERNFIDLKEKSGQLKCVQSQVPEGQSPYDDRFLLQSCFEFNGVIVSNDRFTDFLEDPNFREIIRNKVIRFMFIKSRFIPDPSMDLQKMLIRSSPFLDECEKMKNEPCPYGEKCNYGKKCRYFHERPPQSRSARNRQFLKMYGPKTRENISQKNLSNSYNPHSNNLRFTSQQQRNFENFNLPDKFAQQNLMTSTSNQRDFCVVNENQKHTQRAAPIQPKMVRSRHSDSSLYARPIMTNFGRNDFAFPMDAPDVLQARLLPNNINSNLSDTQMVGSFNVCDQKPFNPWSVEVPTFSPEKPFNVFSDLSPQHGQRKDSLGWDQVGILERHSIDYISGSQDEKSLQSQYFSYFSDGSSQSDDEKNSPTGSCVSSTDFSSIWPNETPQKRSTLVSKHQQNESLFMDKDSDFPMAPSKFVAVGSPQSCVGFEKNQEVPKSVAMHLVSNENVYPLYDNNGSSFSSEPYWLTEQREMAVNIFEKKSENVSFARNWAKENSSMTCSEMGKTSPKSESKGKENVMLKVDSRVQDYICVSQVLTQGKDAQILTVMKNHPDFDRQQIVEHVLAIATKSCCSSQMMNVKKSMEDCASVIGSIGCLNFVRAFLSAESRPEAEKGGTMFTADFNRQVIRNVLGASPQATPVRVA